MRKPPATQQELDAAAALFADGASQREVTRTTGIARETLRKHFPGQFWTYRDGGKFRALNKAAEVKIGRAA